MKKIISILLSVLMAVSMMPLTVFAAEDVAQITTGSLKGTNYATAQEAIDAAVETGVATTVKLLANTAEDIVIPNTNGKTITLKTDGKTITGVSSSAITVKSGAIVVMNDTGSVVTTVSGKEAISNEFGGKITIGTSSYAPKINRADGTTGYVIKNQGTMIIENATVTNGNANDTSALVANGWYNNDEATADVTLTIKKGTYTSTKGITVKNDAKGVLNISGGTFTHGNNSDNVQNWNIATISGGTFNNRVRTIQAKDDTSIGKTTITGGTFNGEIVVLEYYQGFVGTVGISGGTFATKPNEDFITVSDYWYYQTSAGKFVMTTATPTVECNGNQYPSMSIALAQNNYEGEYTLVADSPSFVLPASTDKVDKTIVLNLNGYSVTEAGSGSAIKINGTNANVTINGPGNVYAGKNSSTAATSVAAAVWVTKVADVTINGGNFYAYKTTAGKANGVIYLDAIGSTATINDGNFVAADATTKDNLLMVRPSYAGKANYVLNGGTYNADVENMADVALGDGCVSTDNGDGTFTVAPAIEASVTLNDDVDVNFFIPNELAESVTVVDADGNTVPFTKDETAGETVVTIETLPAQYSDTFTVKAGDVSLDYSVAEYCQAIIDGEYAEKAQDVCKKLLVFGEYANQYYGYGATGVDITPYDTTATVTTDGIASAQMTQGATGLTLTGATFVAEAKSAVRFYYTMDGASVNDYTVTVSNGTSSIDAYFAYNQDDPTKVFVEVSGIGAKELSTQFDLVITNNNDGSATTVKYSPLNYAKSAINANNGASTMAKAIIAYANALDA